MAATEIKVKLRNLHIAPRKVRLVANIIKRMPIEEALAQLVLHPARSSGPIMKLVRSAVANARSQGMKVEALAVKSIMVDEGPMLKRSLPRARGMATPIHKKMSHITLVLGEVVSPKPVRFDLTRAEKKPKKEKKRPKSAKTKAVPEVKAEFKKASKKPGFFKRVFSRKSI